MPFSWRISEEFTIKVFLNTEYFIWENCVSKSLIAGHWQWLVGGMSWGYVKVLVTYFTWWAIISCGQIGRLTITVAHFFIFFSWENLPFFLSQYPRGKVYSIDWYSLLCQFLLHSKKKWLVEEESGADFFFL